jgi:hypothetical protein
LFVGLPPAPPARSNLDFAHLAALLRRKSTGAAARCPSPLPRSPDPRVPQIRALTPPAPTWFPHLAPAGCCAILCARRPLAIAGGLRIRAAPRHCRGPPDPRGPSSSPVMPPPVCGRVRLPGALCLPLVVPSGVCALGLSPAPPGAPSLASSASVAGAGLLRAFPGLYLPASRAPSSSCSKCPVLLVVSMRKELNALIQNCS